MRGTVAEQRSGAGYSLRPNVSNDRGEASGRRAAPQGWEVRLGKLQVTVWLGLAIGAIVGGYFVGFFSGRYVGFESARESSAGEVAKLPAPEMFANNASLNPNGVYDRLKAPAILKETNGPRASAKLVDPQEAREVAAPTQKITISDLAANSVNNSVGAEPAHRGDSEANTQTADGEEIFDDSGRSGELIIGSDEGLLDDKNEAARVPSSVRMLGGTGDKKAHENDSAAMALLDERIASARNETSRLEQIKDSDNLVRAAPANDKSGAKLADKALEAEADKQTEKPAPKDESKGLVRKVLPPGYFAQVAAPKKLSDAEAVAKKLKRSGFPVVVESASVSGQSFYRVLVGPEENKVQADRLVSQLEGESYVASKPFIKKVAR
jgi:cell division septation protein DedD